MDSGHCRIGGYLNIANSAAFASYPCWDLLTEVAKESKHLVNIDKILWLFIIYKVVFDNGTFLSKWQNFGTKGGGVAVLVKPLTSSASGNLIDNEIYICRIYEYQRRSHLTAR